jgi:hypothetical protein
MLPALRAPRCRAWHRTDRARRTNYKALISPPSCSEKYRLWKAVRLWSEIKIQLTNFMLKASLDISSPLTPRNILSGSSPWLQAKSSCVCAACCPAMFGRRALVSLPVWLTDWLTDWPRYTAGTRSRRVFETTQLISIKFCCRVNSISVSLHEAALELSKFVETGSSYTAWGLRRENSFCHSFVCQSLFCIHLAVFKLF